MQKVSNNIFFLLIIHEKVNETKEICMIIIPTSFDKTANPKISRVQNKYLGGGGGM